MFQPQVIYLKNGQLRRNYPHFRKSFILSCHDSFFAIFMKSLKTSVCHESLGRTFQA